MSERSGSVTTADRNTVCPVSRFDSSDEAARPVAVDLRAILVEDGSLAFDDRDQRIASVTDPKEHVADLRSPLLAVLGKQGKLSLGEHGRPG